MSLEEELLGKILGVLERIEKRLDTLEELSSLTKLAQMDSIEKAKSAILNKSALGNDIYNLCDGKHTVSDIAKKLGKSTSSVSHAIPRLEEAYLIIEERHGNQKYYRRVL